MWAWRSEQKGIENASRQYLNKGMIIPQTRHRGKMGREEESWAILLLHGKHRNVALNCQAMKTFLLREFQVNSFSDLTSKEIALHQLHSLWRPTSPYSPALPEAKPYEYTHKYYLFAVIHCIAIRLLQHNVNKITFNWARKDYLLYWACILRHLSLQISILIPWNELLWILLWETEILRKPRQLSHEQKIAQGQRSISNLEERSSAPTVSPVS